MDFNNIDTGLISATLGTLTLLTLVDTVLGAIAAAAGGTFNWEMLYAVGRTKGAVLARIALLLGAGAISPIFDFTVIGIEADPFTALGLALAVPLAASLIASIADNVGKKDTTAPQGVDQPLTAPQT